MMSENSGRNYSGRFGVRGVPLLRDDLATRMKPRGAETLCPEGISCRVIKLY
jgi:hypothetical protein